MITTGSVRGKCSTLQDGHSRFQPACDDVGRRAAIGAEAMPRVPVRAAPSPRRAAQDDRAATRPCTAMERRSVTKRSGRPFSAFVASGSSAMPKRPASPARPRNTVSAVGASARASSGRNIGSAPFAPFFITTSSPPIATVRGACIGLAGGEERRIGAALGDARQNAGGVAEQRLRPEIERHEGTPARARTWHGSVRPSRRSGALSRARSSCAAAVTKLCSSSRS